MNAEVSRILCVQILRCVQGIVTNFQACLSRLYEIFGTK
ncbi:hypothetical protein ABFA07_013889 [Porites harrisoni]